MSENQIRETFYSTMLVSVFGTGTTWDRARTDYSSVSDAFRCLTEEKHVTDSSFTAFTHKKRTFGARTEHHFLLFPLF